MWDPHGSFLCRLDEAENGLASVEGAAAQLGGDDALFDILIVVIEAESNLFVQRQIGLFQC